VFHDSSWLSLVLGLVIVLLCGFAITLIDAAGWRTLLQRAKDRTPFNRLWVFNTASEGCGRILPGGLVMADTTKTGLASRNLNIAQSSIAATVTARRWFLGFTQAVFLLAVALVTFVAQPGFPFTWILLSTSVGLLSLLLIVLFGAHAGHRINPERWARWMRIGSSLEQYCQSLTSIVRSKRNLGVLLVFYICLWILETVETFLLLWLSGIPVPIETAGLVEAVASSVRLVAFFAPAGIGAQEAAYSTVLLSLGVIPTVGGSASFLVWKRVRDILWGAVGVILLAREGIKIPWRKATPQPEGII
jgi:hypothetical protein